MRVRIDATSFRNERRLHELRFCCDDCAYFVPGEQKCAHGWPTADHRQTLYERDDLAEVVFCKEFELR